MAAPMALHRTLKAMIRSSSLQLVRGQFSVTNASAQVCCRWASPCRQYSDKVLEGMGEYVEEEEELDLSLLDEPAVRQSPTHGREPLPEAPWKNTRRWHAKQFAKYGTASGIDPAIMWPTKAELRQLIEEEKQYFPSLQEMQTELANEKRAADLQRLKREKTIAANMAKMPKMIEDYWQKVEEERQKGRDQKAKRAKLLALAKEKLGYAIDPRSPRFKQMVEEMEAEEKKRRKELKKKGIKV